MKKIDLSYWISPVRLSSGTATQHAVKHFVSLCVTCLTLQQYHRAMLSACIKYKITERLRGWQWCSTAIFVITNPSTTSDIDHLILTELIINMTGSCNKENRSCALSKQEPTLRIKSRGHWLRGFLTFISVALSSSTKISFIHVSNYW